MKKALAIILACVMAMSLLLTGCGEDKSADGSTEIDFLICWQGPSEAMHPATFEEDIVGQKLFEATNVKVNFQYITTSEMEKLNIIFASGEMPDAVSAPFWSGSDGHTLLIKKAAREGLITPLNDYIDDYPNLTSAFTQNLLQDFIDSDLEDPAFNGNKYFIPTQIVATPEDDVTETTMLFIRKDIYEALGVDRNEINNSWDVYELLKKIKAGGFKDINGREVIPAGNWHNGYLADQYTISFHDRTMPFTGYYRYEDGTIVDDFFTEEMDEKCKYMRKLVSEGLYDPEAFTQNAARADEKIAKGSIAVIPSNISSMEAKLASSLYVTNPEMEYVPLNILTDKNGSRKIYMLKGSKGSPIVFIPKNGNEEKVIATLKVMNWINSDEGKLLINYGVEGVHHKLVDGQPRLLPEVHAAYNEDVTTLTKQGIRGHYNQFQTRNDMVSRYGDNGQAEDMNERRKFAATFTIERVYMDGVMVNNYEDQYPKIDEVRAVKSDSKIAETVNRSYFAATDEETISILNGYREQLRKGGIQGLFDFINEQVKGKDNILY